jgi:glyceraldehyde 3-phosphate dehydrogenase
MAVRVGINGFGRIGRNFLRAVLASGADVEVVGVNDLTSATTLAHLLRYDSTQGRLSVPVDVEGGHLVVGEQRIAVVAERDPSLVPWAELGAEVVIESTGLFTARDKAAVQLGGTVKRVIISAPSGDADGTFVIGVNDDQFDPARDVVISNASCTTNCFVPMVKVLDDAFGIASGLMTTVHAYTNDQNLLDLPHKDLRRARAAAVNIVPVSTGASRATSLVLSSMKGRLDGTALRVPVPAGSITDFTAVVHGSPSVPDVNAAFAEAAAKPPLDRVLEYTEDPIVSTDIVGSPASCTFDSLLTMVLPVNDALSMVKVQGWYDNEWGYSNRLVDLTVLVGGLGDETPGGVATARGPARPRWAACPGAGGLQRPAPHRDRRASHRGRRLSHQGGPAHPALAARPGGRGRGLLASGPTGRHPRPALGDGAGA